MGFSDKSGQIVARREHLGRFGDIWTSKGRPATCAASIFATSASGLGSRRAALQDRVCWRRLEPVGSRVGAPVGGCNVHWDRYDTDAGRNRPQDQVVRIERRIMRMFFDGSATLAFTGKVAAAEGFTVG